MCNPYLVVSITWVQAIAQIDWISEATSAPYQLHLTDGPTLRPLLVKAGALLSIYLLLVPAPEPFLNKRMSSIRPPLYAIRAKLLPDDSRMVIAFEPYHRHVTQQIVTHRILVKVGPHAKQLPVLDGRLYSPI